jgi:hypothetical protein
MKVATIGLVTALALVSAAALAQGRKHNEGSPPGVTTGAATGSPGTSMGNNAGSVAAMENSAANPSGNSFINTSPSGSTLAPLGSAPSIGGRR